MRLHWANNDRTAARVGDVATRVAKRSPAATFVVPILLAVCVSGCANAALRAARSEITRGDYISAHEKFAAASHSPKLSGNESREIADGLCLTETKIGPPQYPPAQQRRTCADAVARTGSSSGPLLARVDSTERAAINADVAAALESKDVAAAQAAVVRYQSFPGADPSAVGQWSKKIWSALEQQEHRDVYHDPQLAPAIVAVSQRYPGMRSMNDLAFRHWILNNATVSHSRLHLDLHKGAIDLRVASTSLPAVAFNLDRFAKINDAMVARCGCDGRTNIAVEGSGLPAYLLRLDPQTRRSEVVVMPQPH